MNEFFSLLLVIPFIGSFLFFTLGAVSKFNGRGLAFVLGALPLLLLLARYNHWLGDEINIPWISHLNINFHLRIDSLSLLFLYLVAFIIPISIFAVSPNECDHHPYYYGLILLLQGFLFIFFTARDLVVFTVFWEAMLLPLFFIINLCGKENREKAALKFLTYMIAGSILMIAGVLFLYFLGTAESFDLDVLAQNLKSQSLPWIFGIFLLAFAVKTPLFPFHGWLPDAYYEAPTAGTILLSALLSKAGIYGIIRIGIELFSNAMQAFQIPLLVLAIIGVFYGGFAAWRQNDYKRLIAYSSFSHVNFILAGLFIWSETAHAGAILQSLNHGVTIAALFLISGWLEEKTQTTSLKNLGGLAHYFPYLCWFTMAFILASVALPGTNNFVGEIIILFGLFKEKPGFAVFLTLSIILSALYMLRMMQKIYFGEGREEKLFNPLTIDMDFKEKAVALSLLFVIFLIGIYPSPVLKDAEVAARILTERESR
ncbi:complex I subunit 4 family protein [Criblamydia sequanensis]|uniref:NADH-quinone oxidoreductase subunit M n=1 Tax=Candidatus Criblamydia sequanensis CRIB-18 TaxID=1437425 RepID=A0A090DX90_9BACT|nr:NADH-quinone oxidoreductase subunit M [Criblamydia sequanensis]CDR33444.1 NADH-quinone oxidoreductase subunit M [Criblamydia sequanensis CRIB-18]